MKVYGEAKPTYALRGWDAGEIYPEGTKRDAIVYYLFPKNLNGESKRGIQFVRQEADVRTTASALECDAFSYNSWRDVGFIEPSKEINAKEDLVIPFIKKGASTLFVTGIIGAMVGGTIYLIGELSNRLNL